MTVKNFSKRAAQQAAQVAHARQGILEFVVAGDGAENLAMQTKFNLAPSTLKKHLYALRDDGKIGFIVNPDRENKGPRGKWVRAGLAPTFTPSVRVPNPERVFEGSRIVPAVQVGVVRDPLVSALFGNAGRGAP